MNLLFYVEPLIEMGKPYWKAGWATNFSAMIIDALNTSTLGGEYRFWVAVNEPVAEQLNFGDDIQLVVFTQAELVQVFNWSALDASLAWYGKHFSEAQLTHYVEMMRSKFAQSPPDIIITFSPAPFFAHAFPDALVLHMEYAIFSRPPYPETWYLDPVGMLANSFVRTFVQEIAGTRFEAEDQKLLRDFKADCQSLIREKSPFRHILQAERGRFSHLVLLPLQFSDYYGFDGNAPFKSQYDYLTFVLENVPSSIGVVVATHPEHLVLDHDTVKFFRHKYPHFIFHEEFEECYAASQFLIADVDGVITVSSSMGLQAMLFDRNVITLGKCFNPLTSDADNLSTLLEILEGDQPDRDHLLFWILTRYAIGGSYLRDPQWLDAFLRRSLQRFRTTGVDRHFYDLIDAQSRIFSDLTAGLDPDVPKVRVVQPAHVELRRKDALIEELKEQLCETRMALQALYDGVVNSVSWKLTAPLRSAAEVVNRLLGRE